MKKLLIVVFSIIFCLFSFVLIAEVRAPVDLDDKLKRKKKKSKKDASGKKKKSDDKHSKIIKSTIKDKPRRDRSRLSIPDTIINIKDKSEMTIRRDQDWRSLIPGFDKKIKDKDSPFLGKVSRDDLLKKKSGKQTISSFELLYGSYRSLSTVVSTGAEFNNIFYQISYMRRQNDGFDKNGSRLGSSLSGLDNLHIDFGLNMDKFEFSVNGHFVEKLDGLQANTNYFQSRKSSIGLLIKTSYIFSSIANFQFDFESRAGKLALDAVSNPEGVDSYTGKASLIFGFSWSKRRFLSIGFSMLYESVIPESGARGEIRDFSGFIKGGFPIGSLFYINFGLKTHFQDLLNTEAAPSIKLTTKFAKNFEIYFSYYREIAYFDFKTSIIDMPYSAYSPVEDPVILNSIGTGVRMRLFSKLILSGGLFNLDYDRYYSVNSSSQNLYLLNPVSVEIFQAVIDLKYNPFKAFLFSLRYVQRIDTSASLYFEPDTRIKIALKLSIESWGSTIKLSGDFISGRESETSGLKDYFLLGLRFQQQFAANIYGLLQIMNILDSQYVIRENYLEPGLKVYAGINIKF